MVTESLLLGQSLPNGLVLELYDCSRPMAGDRWQVVLEVRLAIAVNAAALPTDLKDQAPEVMEALGPEITFIQQDIRHFIDSREVPAVLQEMQDRVQEELVGYLGLAEQQEKQRWYPE